MLTPSKPLRSAAFLRAMAAMLVGSPEPVFLPGAFFWRQKSLQGIGGSSTRNQATKA